MTYYSVWDRQTNRYLASGRNENTVLNAVNGALSFLIEQDIECEKDLDMDTVDFPTWTEAEKVGLKRYLEYFDFQVDKHEKEIQDEDENERIGEPIPFD